MSDEIQKSEADWRNILTPEQFHVLREKGTERAFSGAYWDEKDDGTYRCSGCGEALFSSESKFDSGTGWPSFAAPIDPESIETARDTSYGAERVEVMCRACGAQLEVRVGFTGKVVWTVNPAKPDFGGDVPELIALSRPE